MKRDCRWCRASFEVTRTRQGYCSEACAKQRHNAKVKMVHNCIGCGTNLAGTRKTIWCSRACKRKQTAWGGDQRACIVCKADYMARNTNQKVCSRKCKRAHDYKAKHPGGYYAEHNCGWCYTAYVAKSERSQYCGKSCRNKASHYRLMAGVPIRAGHGWRFTEDEEPTYRPERSIPEKQSKRVNVTPEQKPTKTTPIVMTDKGYSFSGYSENRPRELTGPAIAGCPHCRRYGTDTLGRQMHHSFCQEVSAS